MDHQIALTASRTIAMLIGFGSVFLGYRLLTLGLYEKAVELSAIYKKDGQPRLGKLLFAQTVPGASLVMVGFSLIFWSFSTLV